MTNSISSPSPPREGRREGTGSSNTNPEERCLHWQPVPLLSCPRGFPKVTSLTEQKMPLWLSSLKIPRLSEALRQQQEEDAIHTSYWEQQYCRPRRTEAAGRSCLELTARTWNLLPRASAHTSAPAIIRKQTQGPSQDGKQRGSSWQDSGQL